MLSMDSKKCSEQGELMLPSAVCRGTSCSHAEDRGLGNAQAGSSGTEREMLEERERVNRMREQSCA